MLGDAVLRVGRLLEASAEGAPYAFDPRTAIAALRVLEANALRFNKAALDALADLGAEPVSEAESERLLAGEPLDKAGRAPTLVPIYAFDEIIVRYRNFIIRLQVAVTVCETGPANRIARSKAWVRCKQVIEALEEIARGDELVAFKEAAIELANAIIERQTDVYCEALASIVDAEIRQTFKVELSREVFSILGLPSGDLRDFERLFSELAVEQKPLNELARRMVGKKDALALWNLVKLLPKLDPPDKLLSSETKLKRLEQDDAPLALEVVPFQNAERLRGIFLWLYDHSEEHPRVDAVGFAAPPAWEVKGAKKDAEDDVYRHAVNAVTASLSADLGQAVDRHPANAVTARLIAEFGQAV